MPKTLDPEDVETIRQLRERGALRDVGPELMSHGQVTVLTCCGDGKRFDDMYTHLSKRCGEWGVLPRFHLTPMLGGCARIVYHEGLPRVVPVSHAAAQEVMLAEIAGALKVQDTLHLIAGIHWPCGMAVRSGLKLADNLALLLEADRLLRERFKGLQTSRLLHVDRGDGMRTYYAPERAVIEWLLGNRSRMSLPPEAAPFLHGGLPSAK